MSSLSSLADASSGAGEELSVLSAGARRGQLFQISTEVKRWQDSVMHLSAVATGKDEALSWERDRNAQVSPDAAKKFDRSLSACLPNAFWLSSSSNWSSKRQETPWWRGILS